MSEFTHNHYKGIIESLQQENAALKVTLQAQAINYKEFEALKQENAKLKGFLKRVRSETLLEAKIRYKESQENKHE